MKILSVTSAPAGVYEVQWSDDGILHRWPVVAWAVTDSEDYPVQALYLDTGKGEITSHQPDDGSVLVAVHYEGGE